MLQLQENLLQDIYATIAYYDAFDYPLTSFEIWKYLMRYDYIQCSLVPYSELTYSQILKAVRSGALAYVLEETKGFYHIKGRAPIVEKRIAANKISAQKLLKLRQIVWLLRFVPFVRMVGSTGKVAMKIAHDQSDLDVLIVAKKGRIWISRTLVTLFAHVLRIRRHHNKISDRICLNYYITDESLEVVTKDIYSANEYSFIFPIFAVGNTYERFQIKNAWIKNIKPQYDVVHLEPLITLKDSTASRVIRKILEVVFDSNWLEKTFAKIEKQKIEKNPKSALEGGLIFVSDEALIFLPKPKGPKIFEKFKKRMQEYR